MGIKLVEELMDHVPDSLTATEWKGLIVLARDANDETRLTYSKVNSPEILHRVRMTPAVWANVRSALIRKGVLVIAEQGVRGRSARYLIPVMCPFGIRHRSDEDQSLSVGNLHGSDEDQKPIRHETDEESAGNLIDSMTPTPLYSSTTTSSSAPSPSLAVAPIAEGGGGGSSDDGQLQAAADFLRHLPAPWTAGRRAAQTLAPLLLDAMTEDGWDFGPELAAQLTSNPEGIKSYAAVLPRRIKDLPPPRPTAAPVPAVNSLPPWCGTCADEDPAARFNARLRLTRTGPCPTCHPNTAAA